MKINDLLHKVRNYYVDNKRSYPLTENDVLSVLETQRFFIEIPELWDDENTTNNRDVLDKLEAEGFIIRADKVFIEPNELMNPSYTYLLTEGLRNGRFW